MAGLTYVNSRLTAPKAPVDAPSIGAAGAGTLAAPPAEQYDDPELTAALKKQQDFYATLTGGGSQQSSGPTLGFSQSQNKMFVNGLTFDVKDAATALTSEQYLSQPSAAMPEGDWTPIDTSIYSQYIEGIKKPGLGKLASRNFDIGMNNMGILAGAGLQFAGMEKAGSAIVKNSADRIAQLAPYQRTLEDPHDPVEWFVANLSQQGPNLLESVATALVGFAGGAVAGGGPNPITGAMGSIAGVVGKTAFKKSVIEASENYIKSKAMLAAAKSAGSKELAESAAKTLATSRGILQNAAGIAGAATLTVANNYGMGVADIYSELRDTGSGPNDDVARLSALARAVPYAALESLPEFVLGARALKLFHGKGGILRRGVVGLAAGGALEGATETGQEALLMGAGSAVNKHNYSDEALSRLANSFAAGFAVGGPIGGVTNIMAGKPADILSTAGVTEDTTPPAGPAPYPQTGTPTEDYTPRLLDPSAAPVPGGQQSPYPNTGTPVRDLRILRILPPVPEGKFGNTPSFVQPQEIPAGDALLRRRPTPEVPPGKFGRTPTFVKPDPAPAVEPVMPTPEPDVAQQQPASVDPTAAPQSPDTQGTQVNPAALDAAMASPEFAALTGSAQEQPTEAAFAPDASIPVMESARRGLSQELSNQALTGSTPEGDALRAKMTALTNRIAAAKLLSHGVPKQTLATLSKALGEVSDALVSEATNGRTPDHDYLVTEYNKLRSQIAAMKLDDGKPTSPAPAAPKAAAPKAAAAKTPSEPKSEMGKVRLKTKVKAAAKVAAADEASRAAEQRTAEADKAAAAKAKRAAEADAAIQAAKIREAEARADAEATKAASAKSEADARNKLLGQKLATQRKLDAAAVKEAEPVARTPLQIARERVAAKKKSNVEVTSAPQPTQQQSVREEAPAANTTKRSAAPVADEQPTRAAGPAAAGTGTTARTQTQKTEKVFLEVSEEASDRDKLKAAITNTETALNNKVDDSTEDLAAVLGDPDNVIFFAFVDPDPNNNKSNTTNPVSVRDTAINYINTLNLGTSQQELFNGFFVSLVKFDGQKLRGLSAAVTRGGKTTERAWYTYAKSKLLLGKFANNKITNIPKADEALFPKNDTVLNASVPSAKPAVETTTQAPTAADIKAEASKELGALITAIMGGTRPFNKPIVAQMKALFKKADPAYAIPNRGGQTIGDFFGEDGKVKFNRLPNKQAVLTASKKPQSFASLPKSTSTAKMTRGAATLMARQFISKLGSKPKLKVYDNADTMRAEDPTAYNEIMATEFVGSDKLTHELLSRMSGLSYGADKVAIFSDNITNARELKFVTAHETIGHFGLNTIMSRAEIGRAMQELYDNVSYIKSAADVYLFSNGLENTAANRAIATEEAMADYAALIDTSTLARLWFHIKGGLNKLGITVGDELARHIVHQSRRYVRYGAREVFGINNYEMAINEMRREHIVSQAKLEQDSATLGGLSLQIGERERIGTQIDSIRDAALKAQRMGKGAGSFVSSALGYLETLDSKARRSEGLTKVFSLFQKAGAMARSLKSKYMEMTSLTRMPREIGGASNEERKKAEELLVNVLFNRSPTVDDDALKSSPSLITIDKYGNFQLEYAAFDALVKSSLPTVDEVRNGFDVTIAGVTRSYSIPDLTEDSKVWKIFLEQRSVINQAAADVLVSKFVSIMRGKENAFVELGKLKTATKGNLTQEDVRWFRDVDSAYSKIYFTDSVINDNFTRPKEKNVADADKFLASILMTLHDDDVAKQWLETAPPADSEAAKYNGPEFAALRAYVRKNLASLDNNGDVVRMKTIQQDRQYKILNTIRDMAMATAQLQNEQLRTKRTIMSNYVPLVREGKYEIVLVARDERGNPVSLDPNLRGNLAFMRFNDRDKAEAALADAQKKLDDGFTDGGYMVKTSDALADPVKVKFTAELKLAPKASTLVENFDYDEFVRVLLRLNVNLHPKERERIVNALAGQHSAARKNLERTGTPGWDPDILKAIGAYAEGQAHIAARNTHRDQMTDILIDGKNWTGDREKLKALQDAVDAATTPLGKFRAQIDYDRYAFKMLHMANQASGKVLINGKAMEPLGEGERYRTDAQKLIHWYKHGGDILDGAEDVFSSDFGSKIKLATALTGIGGNVAVAAVNTVSLMTHTIPQLAFYNSGRGYGGGFGLAAAASEVSKAIGNVADLRLGKLKYLEQILADGSYAKHGLSFDEAYALMTATKDGILQAAQSTSLAGSARGGFTNRYAVAFIEGWMSLFSTTEALVRRITLIAGYRLHRDRAIASGVSAQEFASRDMEELANNAMFNAAIDESVNTVNSSQGDYARYNRPAAARGDILTHLFVFKMFPILTVQMLYALPKAGQITFLAGMLLLSGVKGLPGADDIMDIIDAIAQLLGIPMGDIEKELVMLSEDIVPGSGQFVTRGIPDVLLGITVSSKVGVGDIVPLTGMGRAGADFGREVEGFFGPVYSSVTGIGSTLFDLSKFAVLEPLGIIKDSPDFMQIARNAPSPALKSWADALAYSLDGRITDAQGRVVNNDVSTPTIIARALGFYPGEATQQNDVVRMSKHAAEYAKAIKARQVAKYATAKVRGDTEKMRSVVQDVNDWNERAKGTEFVINDFLKSANRSAKDIGRTTGERYLKSSPKNIRPEAQALMDALGYDSEELN